MKRLNWLKKFGLTAAVASATVPAILTSTSCATNNCAVDVFDFISMFPHDKEIFDWSPEQIKHYNTSANNLLYGTISNNGGNYILIVGSNTNDSVCKWFASENIRGRDQWYSSDFFFSSFYKAMLRVTTTEEYIRKNLKDFGVYTYIDFYDFILKDKKDHEIKFSKNGEDPIQIIKPFDVWDDALITNTYNYNKHKLSYEWDKESVEKGKYIRNDDYAVAYRDICKRGLTLFPKNDKRKESFVTDNNSDAPKLLVYKEGKLVSINNIPSPEESGITSFVKIVTDNYKINEEKKS